MRRFLFIPILALSGALMALLVALGPKPEAQEIETVLPEVRAATVRVGPQRVTVSADGDGEAVASDDGVGGGSGPGGVVGAGAPGRSPGGRRCSAVPD